MILIGPRDPAFGYKLLHNDAVRLAFGQSVQVPARELVAASPTDQERIIYWTRIGEYFPTSSGEQRGARFQNTVSGVVPDGVLCRFSTMEEMGAGNSLGTFLRALITATRPEGRRVLVGTERSLRLSQHA